jgi:hypothetical protein
MLSFYFTFFELLTANRTVTMSLKKYDSNIKNLLQLSGLKESFKTYVADIITDDFRKKVSRISNKINSGKFLDSVKITLKFWL